MVLVRYCPLPSIVAVSPIIHSMRKSSDRHFIFHLPFYLPSKCIFSEWLKWKWSSNYSSIQCFKEKNIHILCDKSISFFLDYTTPARWFTVWDLMSKLVIQPSFEAAGQTHMECQIFGKPKNKRKMYGSQPSKPYCHTFILSLIFRFFKCLPFRMSLTCFL